MTDERDIKSFAEQYGIKRMLLHKVCGIPVKTLNSWWYDNHRPPLWVAKLLKNKIKSLHSKGLGIKKGAV